MTSWFHSKRTSIDSSWRRSAAEELTGREVAVLRVINRAVHVHADVRLEFSQGGRVEHFGGDPKRARALSHMRLFFECVRLFAEHEQPFLHQTKGRGVPVQFFETSAAQHVQLAQERCRPVDMCGCGGAPEFQTPSQEVAIETGLNVEWAFGVPHPTQRKAHHSRRGQGNKMAGHDHPRVAEGAAVGLRCGAVEESHLASPQAAIVGRAQADDAAPDDYNPFAHGQITPQFPSRRDRFRPATGSLRLSAKPGR